MSAPVSKDIRSRMMRGIKAGKSARAMARQYEVAPCTASRLKLHEAETGSIEPLRLGRPAGSGKLGPHMDFLIAEVTAQPDITMPELAQRLLDTHGVKVDPSNISKRLRASDLTYKKRSAGRGTGTPGRKS
jgi:transposase